MGARRPSCAGCPGGRCAGCPAAPIAPAGTGIAGQLPSSGDGYLRAKLGGAIEANIDWPNSGTRAKASPKTSRPGCV